MTGISLTREEQLARWQEAEWLLRHVDFEPPTTQDRIDEIAHSLPEPLSEEPLDVWLRRARQTKANSSSPQRKRTVQRSAVIIPFPNPRFVPLTEFVRRAASSSAERYPLPENGYLESTDGRFRLKIIKDGEVLHISIEAFGLAVDKFANTYVGLSVGNSLDDVLEVIYLDADGDGKCTLPDSEEVRQALLRPIIGVIRDA